MSSELLGNEYLIRRKFFTIAGAKFHIFDPHGNLVYFSKQKAFKLKEDIRIYSDTTITHERFSLKARQIVDFSAAYDVVDSGSGSKLGALRRKGLRSIVKDKWEILDISDQPIATIEEDSTFKAMLRRMLDIVSLFIPQSFHVSANGRHIATYQQNFNPFLFKLTVRIDPSARELLDPRLLLAGAILLSAVEGRQG